ncbi:MAG: nucleotidyltransferase [Verrucomicrobia bacterium]|nr:nucleotidyltransferase [Verrucomicrobiota bacterium]
MTVGTYLSTLASDLVLSSLEKDSIARSISTLSTRLAVHFGSDISNSLQFGSSTRGTILPRKADGKSDIDYMVVFDTSVDQKKPQTYLDRLKRFAETKYSRSDIAQSSPTIILSLNHINFELVPAIYNYGYQIPSPKSHWSDWMSTDPTTADQKIQDKNKGENYQIKPLVRLVKYWNARNGHAFYSFDLEQYIVNDLYWSCTTLRDYFYHFWSRFSCSYNTAQYIKDKVERAKEHARKAQDYEDRGMPTWAELEIKKVVPPL